MQNTEIIALASQARSLPKPGPLVVASSPRQDANHESFIATPANDTTTPAKKQSKVLTNAQLFQYAKKRGLPPPIFDWMPRFIGLPTEVIETILSFTAFHQSTRNIKPRHYVEEHQSQLRSQFHIFNTIAAVSSRLYDLVENYSEFLLKKYATLRVRPQSAPINQLSTHRASWFLSIKNMCAFCLKDFTQLESEAKARGLAVDAGVITRDDGLGNRPVLQGSAFYHTIICCYECERKHWAEPIDLECITRALEIPSYFVLFPPPQLQLQTGRSGSGVFFLSHQILELRNLVRSDTAKYIPEWMPELPACFTDNMSSALAANWMKLAASVKESGVQDLEHEE